MKRILLLFIGLILVLTLVLSIGCSSAQQTTTTPPKTTTPAATTTTTPPKTTTPTTTPAPAKLTSIKVTPAAPADLTAGSTQLFTATGTYSDSSTRELFSVTWTSDNPSVATLNRDGLAKGIAAGKANITATYAGITSPPVSLTVKAAPVVAITMTPAGVITTTIPAGPTVYVSVSVDGKLLLAAQPVAYTKGMTVDGLLKAAHVAYYSDGLKGYAAGIDPSFGIYLITKCWGIKQTPFVLLNDTPAPGPVITTFVDTTPVAANDNVIICTSNTQGAAKPVSLKATLSGDSVTLTATSWIFNSSTYTYTSAPLADAVVFDPATGKYFGKTDDNGKITVTVPASGIVAIEGLAAINVKTSAK